MDLEKKKDKKKKHKKDRAVIVEDDTMTVDSPGTLNQNYGLYYRLTLACSRRRKSQARQEETQAE